MSTIMGEQRPAGMRGLLVRQVVLELVLPLGGYYGLVAAGAEPWLALTVASLLAVPWIVYGIVRDRRISAMPVFTLLILIGGAVVSAVTGDPRLIMVRDSWITLIVGLWVLGTLATRRPFMLTMGRTVVAAKRGEAAADEWMTKWDTDPTFRRHIRVITAVWGVGFTVDTFISAALAYTLPINAIPVASTAQWLVVLGCLIAFHIRYITKHGLKV
jgi:hypothetical protein